MGARNTVDKQRVVSLAEKIVNENGAAALTIDAVAKAAGITKGGVQSSFGTKDALISEMLSKWMLEDDERLAAALRSDPARSTLSAHLSTMHEGDATVHSRVASLMVALLQSAESVDKIRAWYIKRIPELPGQDHPASAETLAFLAAEGAFFLRFFKLVEIDQVQWDKIFAGIDDLISKNGSS